jgi:CheY-like chemotaxis protein
MKPKDRKSVLIVDNNESILETFEEMLENAGFDTRTTWSGHEALALLQSQDFDVLLVDDYLPDLHASDFLERVGRLPIQPWIVVMRGTTPTPGDLRHYESLGASATVNKGDRAKVAEAVSCCCADEPLAKAVAS